MLPVERMLIALEGGRLVTRLDDKVKRSLVGICESLQEQFMHKIMIDQLDSGLVFFYNLGSLLQYHYGEFERAELLCAHAIDLCHQFASESNPSQWLGASLQPLINSARIAAARGQTDKSLEILKRVKLFVERKQDLQMGGYRLPKELISELETVEENIVSVGSNVYLIDSIRAFLIAQDYDGLARFLVDLETDAFCCENTMNHGTLLEAKARALAGLKRYDDALRTLGEFTKFMRSNHDRIYPAIYTLSANIYWQCGEKAKAQRVLSFAEKLIGRYLAMPSAKPTIVLANHSHLIALTYFQLNDLDCCVRNAKTALEMATELQDEVLTMKALILLLQAAAVAPSRDESQLAAWRDMLVRQSTSTDYRLEKALSCLCLWPQVGSHEYESKLNPLLSQSLALLGSIDSTYARAYRQEILSSFSISTDMADGNVGLPAALKWRQPHIDEFYESLINYAPSFLRVKRPTSSCVIPAMVTSYPHR